MNAIMAVALVKVDEYLETYAISDKEQMLLMVPSKKIRRLGGNRNNS